MADAAQTVDAGQTLESHLLLTAQVTLDEDVVAGDSLNNLGQLSVRERARAKVRGDTGLLQHLLSRGGPDAVDVAQGGLNALLVGNFDTEKTSHSGVLLLVMFLFRHRVVTICRRRFYTLFCFLQVLFHKNYNFG